MKKQIDVSRLPKQQYTTPATEVIEIKQQCRLLAGSVKSLHGNLSVDDFILGEESDEDAR